MKRVLMFVVAILLCTVAHAQTETINWYMGDGTTYTTTTCESGGDIILPPTPTKRGYTFVGWDGYNRIEYLESTGTQWIDTGVAPDWNIDVTIFLNVLSIKTDYLFGLYTPAYQYYLWLANGNFQWAWSSQYRTSPLSVVLGKKYKIHLFSDGTLSYFYVDDNLVQTSTTNSNMRTTISLKLFAAQEDLKIKGGISQRVYEMLVYEHSTGSLLHDFIPVLDVNNVPCMFDKVEGKFYYNAGTGDFIAGPVIGDGGE